MLKKKNKKNQPVTQAQFESAMTAIQQDLSATATKKEVSELRIEVTELRTEVNELKEEMKSMRHVQESMFKILESIDGRLKEQDSHEERLTRVERDIFQLKTRR